MRHGDRLLFGNSKIRSLLVDPVAISGLGFRRVDEVEPGDDLPFFVTGNNVEGVPIVPSVVLPVAMVDTLPRFRGWRFLRRRELILWFVRSGFENYRGGARRWRFSCGHR